MPPLDNKQLRHRFDLVYDSQIGESQVIENIFVVRSKSVCPFIRQDGGGIILKFKIGISEVIVESGAFVPIFKNTFERLCSLLKIRLPVIEIPLLELNRLFLSVKQGRQE